MEDKKERFTTLLNSTSDILVSVILLKLSKRLT